MLIEETPSIIVIILIIALESLIEEIRKQRPTSGRHAIKLHHDNAKPHMHKDVVNYLESEGIKIIHQPANSRDPAPCDFWFIRSG